MRCPLCGKTETGQVGNGQYYCWTCCLEFHGTPAHWRLYALDEDGALTELVAQEPTPGEAPGAGEDEVRPA